LLGMVLNVPECHSTSITGGSRYAAVSLVLSMLMTKPIQHARFVRAGVVTGAVMSGFFLGFSSHAPMCAEKFLALPATSSPLAAECRALFEARSPQNITLKRIKEKMTANEGKPNSEFAQAWDGGLSSSALRNNNKSNNMPQIPPAWNDLSSVSDWKKADYSFQQLEHIPNNDDLKANDVEILQTAPSSTNNIKSNNAGSKPEEFQEKKKLNIVKQASYKDGSSWDKVRETYAKNAVKP